MKAEISVIIPVYNGEKTIKRCIASVLNQTFKAVEVIVVDDGSTDNTCKIASSFNDERIVVKRQQNKGQGIARNVGMSVASGKYIGFLDADDTVEPEMYGEMYKAAELHDAEVVQCAMKDYKDGSFSVRPLMEDGLVAISDRGLYAYEYFCRLKHTNEVCNKLFLKKFLLDNEIKFEDTKKIFSEDLKFNIDLLSCLNRIYFIKEAYYNYYISSGGHCLCDREGRIDKMCVLYKSALNNCSDNGVRRAVECSAAVVILSYCAQLGSSGRDKISSVLSDIDVRHYIFTSMTYKSSVKHFALMLMLLILPRFFGVFLVNKFFVYGK